MKLLYFAWLRTKIGMAEERVALPAGVTDVAGLIDWLRGRGDGYAEALANLDVVKVAVNQEYVPFTHPVAAGDEVALFPPVTGG
ncbi:MAG: molybdopterin converting factor subunit 1 [Niveispirillum sp.]|uniref:molybdopterin converting factor subunit 1 n=1 Tax=Niveispirillum sp. TaxID=1917217 RepID=UPI003BA81175